MKILIAVAVLIATIGCSTQKNLTNLVKALSKDPATVRISYGPLIFERFVPQAQQPGGYVPGAQWGSPYLVPQVTPLVPAPGTFWIPSTNVVK